MYDILKESDNILIEFRRCLWPYYLLILVLLTLCTLNTQASTEFTVHRLTQFDVNGLSYGSRTSSLSLEAKGVRNWKTTRHCVVARFEDLSVHDFKDIRRNAGGLVLQLPRNFSTLTYDEQEHICLLEQDMITHPISIPIYFSPYDEKLDNIIKDIDHSAVLPTQDANINQGKENVQNLHRESTLSEMFHFISTNGYQVMVTDAGHAVNKKAKIPIIQGELKPFETDYTNLENTAASTNLPTIIITSNLKTFGLYNEYPLNMDAATLLSLADIFSKFYSSPSTSPKYRLVFVISESGTLLNFQGIKKWLDENQFHNVEFVLCLDTIVHPIMEDTSMNKLYMHVSKPPKENTPLSNIVKYLKLIAAKSYNVTVEGIHKKINLAEKKLLWEHERFSIKRLPAFTFSSLSSPKDAARNTIFRQLEVMEQAQVNLKIIAEALLLYMYNASVTNKPFDQIYQILTNEHISGSLPRAYVNVKSALHNNDLRNFFEKYLQNVKLIFDKPDARDPDFVLYEGHDANLHFYSVKPVIFDLFLTALISGYLALAFVTIKFFPLIYQVICNVSCVSNLNFINFNSDQKYKAN